MTMTMTFAAGLIPIVVAWSVSVGAFEGTPDRVATEAAPQKAVPAERIVEEYLFDLSEGALPFACSADGDPLPEGEGELVTLEGQLYQRFTLVSDGAGGYHFGLNTMPADGEIIVVRDSVDVECRG